MLDQKNILEIEGGQNKIQRLYLQIEDKRLPVVVVGEEHLTSLITGNRLRKTTVTLYLASPRSHQRLLKFLARAGKTGITSMDEEGYPARWKVKENEWRIEDQGYGEIYLHKLFLDEIEPITPTSLVINGLEIHPYTYQEEIDPELNGLVIKARILIDETECEQLNSIAQAAKPVAVVRTGIQEGIRLMILITGFCSQHPEGIKQEIGLAEPVVKKKDALGLIPLNTIYENATRVLFETLAVQEQLLDHFKEKGMVSDAAVAQMRLTAAGQIPMLKRKLLKVRDLDDYDSI
jgi:hypothetical protein